MAYLRNVLAKVFHVSGGEIPRLAYGWGVRFLLKLSVIVGFTGAIAMAIARYSIEFLPIFLMVQALFAIVGMLLFSVIVDRLSGRQLIVMSTLFAICTLVLASFFSHDDVIFLTLLLVASGIFLPQVMIVVSNYLEELFSPLEADRIFPIIDTAESLGGIAGGAVLALFGLQLFGERLVLLWAGLLVVFLLVFLLFSPSLPHFLKKIEEESHHGKREKSTSWNAIAKSFQEIKKIPFLQLLLSLLILHWGVAHIVQFLFTKAVDGSLHASSLEEHEVLLVEGLGALHIFIHGFAFLVELFVVSRIIRSLGTFAGYVFHGVVTLLSSMAMLFGFYTFTAVLMRLNFEITSIFQRHSYETSYYAFRFGTNRSLREFFEGLILPIGTVCGTLIVLGVQAFFTGWHVTFVLPVVMIFLTVMMSYFALQMKRHYTETAMRSFESGVPAAQFYALEILSQRGHGKSFEFLKEIYFSKKTDERLIPKVLEGMARIGDRRFLPIFLDILRDEARGHLHKAALAGIAALGGARRKWQIGKGDEDRKPGKAQLHEILAVLRKIIVSSRPLALRMGAMQALAAHDEEGVLAYLKQERPDIRALAAAVLWRVRSVRPQVVKLVGALMHDNSLESDEILFFLTEKTPIQQLRQHWKRLIEHGQGGRRILAMLALIKLGEQDSSEGMLHLLFDENRVMFARVLGSLEDLSAPQKRHIIHELTPEMTSSLQQKNYRQVGKKLEQIYAVCSAEENHSVLFL